MTQPTEGPDAHAVLRPLPPANRLETTMTTQLLQLIQERARRRLRPNSTAPDADDTLASVEARLAGPEGEPFERLRTIFALSPFEADLLLACVAACTAPAPLSDEGQVPPSASAGVVASHVAHGFGHADWHPARGAGAASRWGLVHRAPSDDGFVCDPAVVAWLCGEPFVDPELVGIVSDVEPQEAFEAWPLDETAAIVRRHADVHRPTRLVVEGRPGVGRRTFVANLSQRLGMSCLAVDTTAVPDARWQATCLAAVRLALVRNASIVWCGQGVGRHRPPSVPSLTLEAVTCGADEDVGSSAASAVFTVRLEPPRASERQRLWRARCPDASSWGEAELAQVGRVPLLPGEIVAAAAQELRVAEDAVSAARAVACAGLADLGTVLHSQLGWDDLVVTADLRSLLQRFAYEARERDTFWSETPSHRLFPRGRGLGGLMSGPPGTGKTMAAQIIAREAGLELLRVDLASIVSKYVGETSKNLRRLFRETSASGALLFFDEADALFAKRTDVKDARDRGANADTGYLLTLVEEHDGVVLLATNKRANLDAAFLRRFRYVLDFATPSPEMRLALWRRNVQALAGGDAVSSLDKLLASLSAVELTAAEIKSSLLTASFVARSRDRDIGLVELCAGVRQELLRSGRTLPRHLHRAGELS